MTDAHHPRFYVVFIETVDPAKVKDYDTGIAFLAKKMYEANIDFESWQASQLNESYYWILGIDSLDELHTSSNKRRVERLMDAVGHENRDRWAARTGPAVRSTATFVMERVEEISYTPARSVVQDPQFANVHIHQILATQNSDEYKALMARGVEAVGRADHRLGWSGYQVVIGDGGTCYGNGNVFYYVARYDRMSQFYEEHPFAAALEKGLGKEGAAEFHDDVMKCQQEVKVFDFKLRPELSYRPGLY